MRFRYNMAEPNEIKKIPTVSNQLMEDNLTYQSQASARAQEDLASVV
jgi:hypothetical protein